MKIKTAVQLTIALSASLAYCDNSDFLFYDVGGDDAIYGVTVDPKDNSIYLAGRKLFIVVYMIVYDDNNM
jgi:hypothetical protein